MADANYNSQLKPVAKSSNGTPLYECKCPTCGLIRVQDKRKIGKQCRACYLKNQGTHNLSNHPLYKVRTGMISRCSNSSASHYKYYGGRGISVCDEWVRSFEAFYDWCINNGYKDGMEIDRIDVDGDYEPSNCRFISHMINSQTRSNARCTLDQAREIKRLLSLDLSVKKIASITGVPYMSVWHISKGNTWRNA